MDWDKAIERNALPLMRIALALMALLVNSRVVKGAGIMVPRHVWRSILLVLRPAEAAVRRLIIIAARGLAPVLYVVPERKVASPDVLEAEAPADLSPESHLPSSTAPLPAPDARPPALKLAPAFRMFDPLKRFNPEDFTDDFSDAADYSPATTFDEFDPTPVTAIPLHNRLRALCAALSDLPAQAARLARFNGRRDAMLKAGRPVRWSPDRPGLPPGWRERPIHEVDPILKECHRLARYLEDTS